MFSISGLLILANWFINKLISIGSQLHIKYTTNSDFDNLDKSKRLGTRIDTRLEKAEIYLALLWSSQYLELPLSWKLVLKVVHNFGLRSARLYLFIFAHSCQLKAMNCAGYRNKYQTVAVWHFYGSFKLFSTAIVEGRAEWKFHGAFLGHLP